MIKECGNCKLLDDCTPYKKQLLDTCYCEDYIDTDCDCLEDGVWYEMSYNRYTDTGYDTVLSEWDKFILKKY